MKGRERGEFEDQKPVQLVFILSLAEFSGCYENENERANLERTCGRIEKKETRRISCGLTLISYG